VTISRTNFIARTQQIVTKDISVDPYVGFEHLTDPPDGWRFDIKRWCSPFDLRLPTLPRLTDPSIQGVSGELFFRSGVGSKELGDLYIKEFVNIVQDGERHWCPNVNNGTYFRHEVDYFFYSDNSKVQYINPDLNRNNRNYIELSTTPNIGSPILAASFVRDVFKESTYRTKINQCYKFTGKYSEGEELNTLSPFGKVLWENVDFTKKEFIVDNTIDGLTRLWFNRDYTERHGVIPDTYEDLGACVYIGLSTGVPYQVFYLSHFPVLADNSFHLYVADSNSWTEWNRVSSWWNLLTGHPVNNSYFVDKDLGIVYFGGATTGGIPSAGKHIIASYSTVLRIEYEELDTETTSIATSADVSPVTQSINQGFVCLSHASIEAASISLSIDKSRIQGTTPPEYGPITVGADYAVLKASVLSASGLPVSGIEVTFTMAPSDLGYLSGSTTMTAVTDASGNAYVNYQPPISAETLGFYSQIVRDSTNPYYPDHREVIILTTDAGLEGKEEEVYLYQILKDDPLLGYQTIEDFLQNLYQETTPVWVHDATDYIKWKSEIMFQYDIKDWDFDLKNGRKVVVYQIDEVDNFDPYAINPITGEHGAVVPVRPVLIEKINDPSDDYNGYWRLIYPEGAVLDCGNDPGLSVGGYWIASSKYVSFNASCWSPYYNQTIISNTIRARVQLPEYLLGEYLKNLEKIPFGWKLIGDTDNVAAGLDGATFITINPHSGPYKIIDLVNDTGPTGDWASSPFNTLNFEFFIE